jgi:hypothetical protein
MSQHEQSHRFLQRFESIRHRMRRVNLGSMLCWALLGGLAFLALLAWLDYRFEDGWSARALRLAGLGAALVVLAAQQAWRIVRRWSRWSSASLNWVSACGPRCSTRRRRTTRSAAKA